MAKIILGQANPGAASLTDIYTVPANKSTVVSSYTIANRSASVVDTWRVSVAKNGAVDDLKQYIDYDIDIPAKESFKATLGITLAAGDVIRVRSLNGTLSFNFFGDES